MSHELRTPLNAIIGYSEMLIEDAEGRLDGRTTEDLQRINRAGRHLLGLITNVLELSKIEAGRMELQVEEFDRALSFGPPSTSASCWRVTGTTPSRSQVSTDLARCARIASSCGRCCST